MSFSNLSFGFINRMIYSVKNEHDSKHSEEMAEIKSKVKKLRLEKKIGGQGF